MENEKIWWDGRDKEISEVFNRFAGLIVNPDDPQDPVLKEMALEANMHFGTLRLVPPGTGRNENDIDIARVNVELVNAGNGKWRIGNRFFRG